MRMDRKGRNWGKGEIPGSGGSIRGYILTYMHMSTLGSEQWGP